jgi:hypothetical protein
MYVDGMTVKNVLQFCTMPGGRGCRTLTAHSGSEYYRNLMKLIDFSAPIVTHKMGHISRLFKNTFHLEKDSKGIGREGV